MFRFVKTGKYRFVDTNQNGTHTHTHTLVSIQPIEMFQDVSGMLLVCKTGKKAVYLEPA